MPRNPDGDIEIEYTGLRPAEKLFEELLIGTNVTGTEHPMIMRAMEHHLPWSKMQRDPQRPAAWRSRASTATGRSRCSPSPWPSTAGGDIRDHVWTRKAVLPHAPGTKVADFAAKRRQSEAGKPAPDRARCS